MSLNALRIINVVCIIASVSTAALAGYTTYSAGKLSTQAKFLTAQAQRQMAIAEAMMVMRCGTKIVPNGQPVVYRAEP